MKTSVKIFRILTCIFTSAYTKLDDGGVGTVIAAYHFVEDVLKYNFIYSIYDAYPETPDLEMPRDYRYEFTWPIGARFWYGESGEGLNTHNTGVERMRVYMKELGVKNENVYVNMDRIISAPLPFPIY